MKGKSIYFTGDEIIAMSKFLVDFDIYIHPVNKKKLSDFLVNNGMWLSLYKFSCCKGAAWKTIYFSYKEINFMADFICEIDEYFPEADEKPLKEQLIRSVGKPFYKFVLCFNKYYGSEDSYPLMKKCNSFSPDVPGCQG